MRSHLFEFTVFLIFSLALSGYTMTVPDFQISEDAYPGITSQSSPAAAGADNGNFVICWRDMRDDGQPHVYFQLYDAHGISLGGNRRVSDEPINDQSYSIPAVAMMGNGRFVIVYNAFPVSLKRFDASGNLIGEQLTVADSDGPLNGCRNASVAINDNGHGIVIFTAKEDINPSTRLWGRYFDFSSGLVGDPFPITEAGEVDSWEKHSVVISDQDKVYTLYERLDQGGFTVFGFRHFEYQSTAVSPETIIDQTVVVTGAYMYEIFGPKLAWHSAGVVGVTWTGHYYDEVAPSSYVARSCSTFVDILDAAGSMQHQRIPVVGYVSPLWGFAAGSIQARGDHFTVGLCKYANDTLATTDVGLDGSLAGSYTFLNSGDQSGTMGAVSMISLDAATVAFVWDSYIVDNIPDVYARIFPLAYPEAYTRLRVNDDFGAPQKTPAIAVDQTGQMLALWIDYRQNMYGSIFGQRLDADGQLIGGNFAVRDGSLPVHDLRVGSNGFNRAVAVWDEGDFARPELWMQVFDYPSFKPVGGPTELPDEGFDYTIRYYPDVAVAADKSFVIAWRDRIAPDVLTLGTFIRAFNPDRSPRTGVIQVNTSIGYYVSGGMTDFAPSIAMRDDGSFAVIWIDGRPGRWAERLVMQVYNSAYQPIGSNIDAVGEEYAPNAWGQIVPQLAVNDDGIYGITWTSDITSSYFDQIGVWFLTTDASGNVLTSPFQVQQVYSAPCDVVAGPDGNFVIAWNDPFLGNDDIWLQKMTPAAVPIGGRRRLSNDSGNQTQRSPVLAMNGSTIVSAWEDFRSGQGSADIFAAMIDWQGFESTTCGDANADYDVNVGDVVFLVNRVFKGGPAPSPACAGDANSDAIVNVADAVYLVNHVFRSGPPPAAGCCP